MTNPVSLFRMPKAAFAGMALILSLSAQVQTSAQHRSPPPTVPSSATSASPTSNQRQFLQRYCAGCHNQQLKSGGLTLVQSDLSRPGAQPELWEKVVRKLRTGVMPPPNVPQPPGADRLAIVRSLEA